MRHTKLGTTISSSMVVGSKRIYEEFQCSHSMGGHYQHSGEKNLSFEMEIGGSRVKRILVLGDVPNLEEFGLKVNPFFFLLILQLKSSVFNMMLSS